MPLPIQDLIAKMQDFQQGRVLIAAVELDIFTAVGQGATAEEVAGRLGASVRGVEALLNALAAIGALVKQDGVFQNTPDTERFLTAGSMENRRSALMHTVNVWKTWTSLTDAVRTGTSVTTPGIEKREQDWTESFIAAMHSNALNQAEGVVRTVGADGVRRMLDVGGGSGAYSIAFAEANPHLHAEVFDLPFVTEIARRNIADAGVAGRVSTRPGDLMRDELGEGYDLILLSAILHMLGPEENLDLLRRCYRALAQAGRVVIRDFILNDDKTAPVRAALFSLNMLVGTRNGASYSETEYRTWLAEAGFVRLERPDPAGDLMIAWKP